MRPKEEVGTLEESFTGSPSKPHDPRRALPAGRIHVWLSKDPIFLRIVEILNRPLAVSVFPFL